jgi:hypothetical protein
LEGERGGSLNVRSIPMVQYVLRPTEEFVTPNLGLFKRRKASLGWTQTSCDHMGFCCSEQSTSRRVELPAHIAPRGALSHGLWSSGLDMSCAFSSWGRYQESLAERRFGLCSDMSLTNRSSMGDLQLLPLKYVSEAACRPPSPPPTSSSPELVRSLSRR